MDDKKLFNTYLQLFEIAEFPLTLTYDVMNPEPFGDDPIPALLTNLFVAEDKEEEDPAETITEYVPVVQFRINKNYIATVVWKATVGAYEFLLIVYDNDGNIQEIDAVAGTYYASLPITYKVAQFLSPIKAAIVEGNIDPNIKDNVTPGSQNFILNISEIGEINYAILGKI